MIAFSRENFLHTPAEARAHMRFVHFDGSRNRVATIPAASEQEKQRQNARYAHRVGMNSRARIISRLLVFPNERRIHAFRPFDVSARAFWRCFSCSLAAGI